MAAISVARQNLHPGMPQPYRIYSSQAKGKDEKQLLLRLRSDAAASLDQIEHIPWDVSAAAPLCGLPMMFPHTDLLLLPLVFLSPSSSSATGLPSRPRRSRTCCTW